MRRWNGWGDDGTDFPVPAGAAKKLAEWIGPGTPPADATLAVVVAQVPPSRLPEHPLVDRTAPGRARHARGQSLPDWVTLRSGRVETFPDGVAHPRNDEEVRGLINYAKGAGAQLIPYGGGTSVVGHINALPGDAPVLTVAMGHLSRLRHFDAESLLATFGAGVSGPQLETQLRAHGCTLGHFPQSFEYSTLGGWVATRSSGQQSLGYGRIDDLFAGGRLEAPAGVLDLPATFPASAAGPDLRRIVLGSEGRLGILTEVTVRTSPLPEAERFRALFFPDFESGRQATREMIQAGLPLSMLRLSTARETETTLILAGRPWLIAALEKVLAWRGIGDEKTMLLFGASGRQGIVKKASKEALHIAGAYGGGLARIAGERFGQQWRKGRFRTPYLRNSLWRMGYAVDTLETAVAWPRVNATIEAVEGALQEALAGEGERVHAFTHLSHFYRDGSSVYTTYLFRLAADPAETLRRWRALKTAASEAILSLAGTISHQHGVGTDHAPYLAAEKGALGMGALEAVAAHFDPQGMMNPGKLLASDVEQP